MMSSQVSDFGSPRVPSSPACFSSPVQSMLPELQGAGSDDSEPVNQSVSKSNAVMQACGGRGVGGI